MLVVPSPTVILPEMVASALKVKVPSAVIDPMPDMSPVLLISQSEVLIEPRSPPSPKIKELLAVMAPVTVRAPPKEVRLEPETVKVLSRVVAPWRVSDPGVVVDPIVLIDDAPLPKVVLSEEERMVNEAVLGVVEPIVPGMAQVPPSRVEELIVPLPLKSSEAPVPTIMAAEVLVELVIPEKGIEGVPPEMVPVQVRLPDVSMVQPVEPDPPLRLRVVVAPPILRVVTVALSKSKLV